MTNADWVNVGVFIFGLLVGLPIGATMLWNHVTRTYFMKEWPDEPKPELLKRVRAELARQKAKEE